ncbi:helix-turn-helix transcriptional regulator [Bifidobacterium felsineum]|uniref:helix-turn-helix transcriptional regulator n=1 Tax=Bifidobacterium felsineum TaxID=2045440 RepID=UPI001BDD0C79|nr:AraC family transcriptional regulator [Bifidobacterium felsineum]MBT1164736.1 AraC family transcriptional regulator [Bifidobacterium felsineum]
MRATTNADQRSTATANLPSLDIELLRRTPGTEAESYIDLAPDTERLDAPVAGETIVNDANFSRLCQAVPGLREEDGFGVIAQRLGYRSQPIRHDYVSLTHLVDGSMLLITAHEVYVVEAGDFIAIPKQVPHVIAPIVRGGKGPAEWDLLFSDGIVQHLTQPFLQDAPMFPPAESACVHIPAAQARAMKSCTNRMVSAYRESGFRLDLAVFGAIMELCHAYNAAAAQLGKVPEIQKRVQRIIDDNLADIDIDTIAQHLGYSAGYLSRRLKKETGRTVGSFILEARLDTAQQYLSHTDMSVARIAERIGYASVSYFYKAFSKRYHQTPLEYRAIFNDAQQSS